jgi:hypothetical protein
VPPQRVARAQELAAPSAEASTPVGVAPVGVVPVAVVPVRPSAAELAARFAGPLALDLARIVLPHRVADIPPPPEFVFRPFVSSRRRSVPAAAPPLPLLGYRVVDARVGAQRVERRWRVDIAPCLGVGAERRVAQSLASVLPEIVSTVLADGRLAVENTPAELDALAQVLFPDTPVLAEPVILEPVEPPSGEPPIPELSDLVAQQLPPEDPPKKKRRRAARVASSASLVAAALPGNAELSRQLAEIENEFAERRSPAPARNRRQRRAAPATSEPPPRRAANAV